MKMVPMVSLGCNCAFQRSQCQLLRGGITQCATLFLLVCHSQLPVVSDLWDTMLFQVKEWRRMITVSKSLILLVF